MKLASIGVAPEDISHIVMSHLHYDHSGGMMSFPKAQYWVQQAEWDFAWAPPVYQEGLYLSVEFDVPRDRLNLIEGPHDLFGDGTIRMIPTPGHSKGHQALLAKGEAAYLLTADAAYEPDLAEPARLPAASLCWSPDLMVASRIEMQRLRDEHDAMVICTHDIAFRSNVRMAPDGFYE